MSEAIIARAPSSPDWSRSSSTFPSTFVRGRKQRLFPLLDRRVAKSLNPLATSFSAFALAVAISESEDESKVMLGKSRERKKEAAIRSSPPLV